MTNRFPLIVDSSSQTIKELAASDNLDLTSSGIVNATSIGATSINVTGIITATTFSGNITGNINSSGISTVTSLNATNINASGIVTTSSLRGYSALVGTASSTTTTFIVTVASKTSNHRYFGTGSGSAYFIDGIESPFLTLLPGKTYRFTQEDGSNSSHQLLFYYQADRTTQYTTNVTTSGTAGSAGAYTEIVVTDTTPVVLHYQCINHGYMGNAAQFNSNVVDTPYQITARSGINVSGISTLNNVIVGGATTALIVNGNARVTGILTVGTSSLTLDGVNDRITVGTGLTITSTEIIIGSITIGSGSLTGTATSTTNIPNLTGAITSVNTTTSLGSFSSSNLSTALTDKTGTGVAVFATSPTLITPVLGAASATSINVTGVTTSSSGFVGALTGLASSATQLATGRTVEITGDLAYTSGSFDGTSNVTGTGTLATVNSNVGSFGSGGSIPTITVNAKGLVTGVTTTAVNPANDGTLTLSTSGTGLSGSASFTANQSEASSFTVTSNATNANTVSTLVARDASGNFSAGTITAALTGTASSTTNIPNLTGAITSVNTTTSLGSFSSSNLSTALTDKTGTGVAVFATSPTLATPVLGSATATSVIVGSGVTINASGIVASAGIITASQFSTGASGTGINITTNTISGPATLIIDPAAVEDNTGAVRIKGDLFVDGTQFIVNSTIIELADFVVGIASTATTDILADGAGIKIGPDNTLTYDHTNTALKSSENFNLASGKTYKINGTNVLSATTLGSAVVNSSLTSVGILTTLTISGDLIVQGTTQTQNSQTLTIEDKNVVLGAGATQTDASANAGGIILKGTTDITFLWINATDSWTSSENLDIASGKVYKVNSTEVLSSTTIGSGVTNSSLTSVGTLTNLSVGNVNSSGIITATTFSGNLKIDAGDIQSSVLTTSSTSQAVVMSISASTYRSVQYQVQVTEGTNYNMTIINIIHDDTTTYMTEYGTINQPTGIATFSSDISGGSLRLLGFPASSSSTTFKVIRTAINS